jgi:hypothetical protein
MPAGVVVFCVADLQWSRLSTQTQSTSSRMTTPAGTMGECGTAHTGWCSTRALWAVGPVDPTTGSGGTACVAGLSCMQRRLLVHHDSCCCRLQRGALQQLACAAAALAACYSSAAHGGNDTRCRTLAAQVHSCDGCGGGRQAACCQRWRLTRCAVEEGHR